MISLHKHLLLLILFAFNILYVSGTNDNNSTCTTLYANSTATLPSSVTTLDISYPTNLPVYPEFYSSTSGNIEVTITLCSTDSNLVTAVKNLFTQLAVNSNGALLSLTMPNAPGSPATSAGGRLTVSMTVLLGALFASFLFPKYRISGLLILALVCMALCAPAIQAQSTGITIRVGLPPQITQVCENDNKCFNPNLGNSDPTNPPTDSPTSSGSSTSGNPSDPTSGSSTSGNSSDPTNPPSNPTGNPTSAPTTPPLPVAFSFNLRVLILSKMPANASSTPLGADFATLAFASVGMPYDYVKVDESVDLSTYLGTSGDGKYSGIVSVYTNGKDPLSAAQNALITAYQTKYHVKWVIVGAQSIDGLSGVSAGSLVTTEYFDVTFAPEFAKYGQFLNQSISVNTETTINWSAYQDTPCTLLPITITDPSTVTPVINANPSSGKAVAAAVFEIDGNERFVYFLTQGAQYIHSMAFASVMVNWISPGGLFIGARRLTFSVQPDDLFLGSYIWNLTTHTNPVNVSDTFYRITADDLQLLSDQIDAINAALPEGSYITVEWPVNFGGINDPYYNRGEHDYLHDKALELIDKFYYLSHTWDHPCTFDLLDSDTGYTTMHTEVATNQAYAPQFFGDKMHLFSNFSMITPCVTGLYNGGALKAMDELGLTACVSDESVDPGDVDFEPITPYHGVYTAMDPNGYAGIYLVPREALDIDYCARTPEDVIDEYMTLKEKDDPTFDFDGLMDVQRMYAIEDKIAFRHDPFMMHQTNAAAFSYSDPTPDPRFGFGSTYNTSLVALYMQRVAGDIMLYYSLPIVTIQMDNLVNMFKQRQEMDSCGISAKVGIDDNGKIVQVTVSSQDDCKMSLSGGAELTGDDVTMEKYGVETTAWIDLHAQATQNFILTNPINL